MTLISLTDLLRGRLAATIFNDALAYIAAPPDPDLEPVRTSNWQTGGVFKTLLARLALELETLWQMGASFAGSAFLRYAPDRDPAFPLLPSWLEWLGEDFFGEERQKAVAATVVETVDVAAGFGAFGPQVLRVKAANGQSYVSTSAVTLAAGPSTAQIAFVAEKPGALGNVGAGQINKLVSPNVLGVIVTNAAAAAGGSDLEAADRYRARLAAKWGALSTGSTRAAYEYWALTASSEVKKVAVLESSNNGTFASNYVTVVLAGDGVPVSGGAVGAVSNFINARIPLGTKLFAKSAVVQNVTLIGTVKVAAASLATAPTDVANSLAALDRRVPIGGYNGIGVALSSFVDAVTYDGAKVLDVQLSTPAAPIALAFDRLLVTNPAGLTYVAVP